MLKIKINDKNKLFFASDHHFFHENVAKKRCFNSVEEMNEMIISSHNNSVLKDDIVFFLGDVALFNRKSRPAQRELFTDVLNRLNGIKYFIRGNHDHDFWFKANSYELHDSAMINVVEDSQHIYLSHYAHITWPLSHRKAWHLHGHSHGSLIYPYPDDKILDVSIDNFLYTRKFAPLSYIKIKDFMDKRYFVQKDHHVEEEMDK